MCNTTRWNSDLALFNGFVKALKKAPGLQDQLNAFKKHGKVSREELRLIKELTFILEPFKEATDELQKDSETVGSLVPAIVDLKNKMTQFSDETDKPNPISACISFAKDLLDSLEKRFTFVFKDNCFLLGNTIHNKFNGKFSCLNSCLFSN